MGLELAILAISLIVPAIIGGIAKLFWNSISGSIADRVVADNMPMFHRIETDISFIKDTIGAHSVRLNQGAVELENIRTRLGEIESELDDVKSKIVIAQRRNGIQC